MSANNRAPSSQFYWKDWLTDDAVERMTFDERGRYMQVLAKTHQTDQPGVCSEEDVRCWASYSATEWPQHRDAIRRAFKMRSDGMWIQKRTVHERAAQRERFEKAQRGGKASAARPRDSRGQFVTRQENGLERGQDRGQDRGGGAPSSAPSSSERNNTTPADPASQLWHGLTPPRDAANGPRGLELIGGVLARATDPAGPRGETQVGKVFSFKFLEAQRARFPHVDVFVLAAQISEELPSGKVDDPKALLVWRCRQANGEIKPGHSPEAPD